MLPYNLLCLADAVKGRYILMSGGGKLSCWDTATHTFNYQEALEGMDHPGYLIEALPGSILGFTLRTVGEKKQGILYGLDPVPGKILWTQEVPTECNSARMPLYSGPHFYRRGPDGFVWTYFDDVLVRIDPRTAEVHPVGRLQKKAFVGFANGEVYVAGHVGLTRVKGLSVPVVR